VRTIVHLSDLHAGRVHAGVVDALVRTIRSVHADLVVVSGDLTQRATDEQFREARAFLDALDARTLVIPGNHDVPFWNVAARFVTPLDRYRAYITDDLAPVYEDQEIVVAGVNTARSLAWGGGRINREQVAAVLETLRTAPPSALRIVVTHHPFDLPPGVPARRILGRARMAMARLATAGADLFLSGHLHISHVSHSAERYRIAGHSALIVQAGTVSMRGRGEAPSFNLLRIEHRRLALARFVWDIGSGRFEEVAAGLFEHAPDGWRAAATSQ
jgi:3',5'-cyclic AMP phosphodiesterase CpdA